MSSAFVFDLVLVFHVTTGATAVALGVVPMASSKGSPLHRRFGRWFAAAMALSLAGACVLTALHPDLYFAALTATAALQLWSGVRVLRRKRPDLHHRDRAGALDWIVALAVAAVGVVVLWRLAVGDHATGPSAVAWALGGSALGFAAWDLWRFLRPAAFPFFPGLWLYEHLVRMLSAYAALLSAFAGNALPFVPEPWKQLWPIVLMEGLTVAFILSQAVRKRAPATP